MSFDSFLKTAGRSAPTSSKDIFVEARMHSNRSDGLYFTVPSWDDGKHLFGPAKWQGVIPAPTEGDTLLVLFLGGGVDRPWVVSVSYGVA